MTDIVLTHGYRLGEDAHERKYMMPYPPLGLLCLAPWLSGAGFEVRVVDATFDARARHHARIAAIPAPVLGVYANMMTRAAALDLIALGHALGRRVVLGGPDPSEYVEEYLAAGADAVVIGEGEQSLSEALPRLLAPGPLRLEGVKGLAWRDEEGRLQREPARLPMRDLSRLPWPDRSAIDLQPYLDCWREHHGRSSLNLITARGCAWRCRWCSHAIYGHRHARRRPEDVAEEVAWLQATYAPDQLWYADDVFTASRPWLRAYAEAMRARGLRLPFECITRADRVDVEMAGLLAELGCFRVWLGSESGSQPILDAMERGVSPAQIARATACLQAAGIEVGLFVMWGYEGETLVDIAATIAHVLETRPDRVLTTVAYPIRGTPYYAAVADRVRPLRPWSTGSDRDHAIRGRHSKAYYAHASRWLGLARERQLHADAPRSLGARLRGTRAAIGIARQRWGMRRRAGEREA